MRILFNLMNCGLSNNGGSMTLIKSANTLQKLGHDVKIIDSGKSLYTWSPINVEHIISKSFNNVPDADIIIGTGFGTIRTTVRLPDRCGVKFHWIRGFETWIMSEKQIIMNVLNPNTIKMVNSICLQNKLSSLGFESKIIRPGYDLTDFTPLGIRNTTNEVITIGGLYNKGSKRETKRVNWIFEAIRKLKRNYKIQLWMMGNERDPHIDIIDKYFMQPDMKTKNKFYNYVNIWLAPTELEGSHIPPAEAMLTNCPVVCTNAPMNGMQDYVINGQNGLVTENNFDSFANTIEKLLKNPNEMFSYGSLARKVILQLGCREDNMIKMVKFFEKCLEEQK